ncbi:chromosome segregation protein SMC [Ruminiclostridium papyrosolvens DSM 2782]|uniref:Chromosome partition protein Smc n=1 Tax=Ruminiclostridium papyrosolvens DSM 2782 TaxID=588581 RepID=F1TI64_9FIRM|nr:chromosome segregation protein SMC [Ruminiclostridium papyrosolvens]EGD45842.1 chromosome segregation protein SMC [Ruminiclostridium papyrosolvens DSM 2782]WES36325.1 chromosome segregation protein SMC [Ruminiclostridium papyrosolvens DSM 2782]
MYLRKLEIQGFKSFADKISLDFHSGITAVVGPNGSGKSNIGDAVRWVLGEQSAKTLRGSKMEDVIFAGTEHRKPVGFAEVSLTIDNDDNYLPVSYSEVTITRRVYRSGESEYYINKTSCRLKDIHELFLDTGIGRDGYSIIGQGRVDEILSSKSEDRRLIFEEASGIMKYKVRKQDAERKLNLTEQNLVRINDIINELESQLEPLREQSEAAKKYLTLRENLKELEVNVYLNNIDKLKEKIKEYEIQFKDIRDNIEAEERRLRSITTQNQQKTELLKKLDEHITEARGKFYLIEANLEKNSSEVKLKNEKINSLNTNIVRIKEENSEISSKLELLNTEEKNRQKKIEYLNGQYSDFSKKLEKYQAELDGILSTLDESERQIEMLKSGIMDKLDIQSDKRTQINNIKNHIENLRKRQNSIGTEVYSLKLEKDKDNMKKEDLIESIRNTSILIKHSSEKINELNNEKTELKGTLSDLEKQHGNIRTDIQVKTSRHKMLKDMENSMEGYSRSVKEVMTACRQSPELGKGIHGTIAQLVEVDKKYETAIEMTLGSALQNIVTSSEDDAKKAIEFLKRNRVGRATFLPITSVKGKRLDDNTLRRLESCQGFCGVASDLVTSDSAYNGIVLNLLGRVVVTENLDSGISIARKFGYTFRIVTLEGDILSTSGSMSGGSNDHRSSGILSRSREISELENIIEGLKKDEIKYGAKINDVRQMLLEIDTEFNEYSNKLRDNELIKTRDENHLQMIEDNLRKTDAKIGMLINDKEKMAKQEQETLLEQQKYEVELEAIETDISETKAVIAEHQEKFKADQTVRDDLHQEITDFKISVNSITESIQSVTENLDRIKGEREALTRSHTRKQEEINKANNEIELLKQEINGLDNSTRSLQDEKTGKTLEIDRLVEEKKVLEEESTDFIEKLNTTNKTIHLLHEEYNRIDIKKAKAEAEMKSIQDRMWDEYELTYSNAVELKKEIENISEAQRNISEYRAQIKALGPVNVSSIDEYIKTKERFEFMSVQKNDMEQAKDKLHKIIHEMVQVMKKQFVEQFKLINENFGIVYKELFGGGKAELIISDEDNVLESGIEIEVQPPGKKLQNMMLLSGGERAFTAIALLFAILRLKPTPFCLLDEIEAALDDANVYRFGEYLKKYSHNTQFIMVTHRKGTMESADTMYGVTMQEHGVSKVVSMKMGELAS